MKKINKFWKLFNKDSNHKTITEENSETPQATTEFPQPTKEEETEHSENTQNTKDANMNHGKAKIYNLIIVDESGSMSHLREATLSGINETIGTIRSAQEEFETTQEHTLTLSGTVA